MDDQVDFVLGVLVMVIFFLSLYCAYVHFSKWCVEDHLKNKKEMANYYQEKYESLKRRHEYLKRSSARVAQLYKFHRERTQTTQKQDDLK